MNTHFGMTSQKITDCLGLMRAQVITDDMQRLLLGLACDEIFQKRDELCAGVAGASLANHLAAGGMERRVQRERPVAVILKAMSFGPARGEWQNPIQPVQPLDGTLLVDAEDRRVKRGLEVKSNDVGCLLFKLRVSTGHVAPESMGLDPGASPDPGYSTVRNAQMPSQLPAAPMSRTVGRRLLSSVQNLGFVADDVLRDNLATVPGIKPRQALPTKTFFPARDEILAAAFLLHDRAIRLPARQPEDHLSTPHFSGLHCSRSRHFFQFPPLMRRQFQPRCCHLLNLPNKRFGNQ